MVIIMMSELRISWWLQGFLRLQTPNRQVMYEEGVNGVSAKTLVIVQLESL